MILVADLGMLQFGPHKKKKIYIYIYIYTQGDRKVSVHLMITIQKVTSNIQSLPSHSPDIY
jgi:hypothetical protein